MFLVVLLQVLCLNILVKGSDFIFDPPLEQLEGIMNRLVTVIVESAHKLPRVITNYLNAI